MQAASDRGVFEDAILLQSSEEYFLVAPWFFDNEMKFKIMALYQFARVTDDIADDFTMDEEERLRILKEVDGLLESGKAEDLPRWLLPFYRLTAEYNLPKEYGHFLLSAFMQDLKKKRYKDWGELIQYCNRSAAPVGRAILHIFNEKNADIVAADALCHSLQILNHLKDLKEDYRDRNIVYFPENWFDDVNKLAAKSSNYNIKRAKKMALAEVAKMLIKTRNLPKTVKSFRLKMFFTYTINIAECVAEKLTKTDPLKNVIDVTGSEKFKIFWKSLWQVLRKQP